MAREDAGALNQTFKGGKQVNSPVEGINPEVEYLTSSKNMSEKVLKISPFNQFSHTPQKLRTPPPQHFQHH